MSNNRLVFDGLEELKAALRALPAELAAEASPIVTGAATAAQQTLVGAYPSRTGNLRSKVSVTTTEPGPFGAGAVVKNTAKHAWLYDNGSQARHYVTTRGKVHSTGRMWGKTPPTHLFVRTIIQKRREMYERLKELLTRNGLEVSGDA